MKPQDILFIVGIALLLLIRKPKLFVASGMVCLLLAIPLFAKWVFFTAERLTWYAAACFFLAIVVIIFQLRDNKNR